MGGQNTGHDLPLEHSENTVPSRGGSGDPCIAAGAGLECWSVSDVQRAAGIYKCSVVYADRRAKYCLMAREVKLDRRAAGGAKQFSPRQQRGESFVAIQLGYKGSRPENREWDHSIRCFEHSTRYCRTAIALVGDMRPSFTWSTPHSIRSYPKAVRLPA